MIVPVNRFFDKMRKKQMRISTEGLAGDMAFWL